MQRLTRKPARIASAERGAVIFEFALVALAFYFLLAAALDMGRMMFTAQVVQDAARIAARELALTPLPPDIDFDTAMDSQLVKDRVFDRDQLVIDLEAFPDAATREQFLASLPPVNQALRPAMIFDEVRIGETTRNFLRYPGALLLDENSPSGYTVGIPLIEGRGAQGGEVIRWVPVIEEIRTDPDDPATGPFSLTSPGASPGLVAIRINYPFQGTALSSYAQTNSPTGDSRAAVVEADDGSVSELNTPPQGTLDPGIASNSGPYSGPYGLGTQGALAKAVRPFRKVIAAQAIFRREVF